MFLRGCERPLGGLGGFVRRSPKGYGVEEGRRTRLGFGGAPVVTPEPHTPPAEAADDAAEERIRRAAE